MDYTTMTTIFYKRCNEKFGFPFSFYVGFLSLNIRELEDGRGEWEAISISSLSLPLALKNLRH